MTKPTKIIIALALIVLTTTSCSTLNAPKTTAASKPVAINAQASTTGLDNLNATLYMQTAAEYQAATQTLFALANQRLQALLRVPSSQALPNDEWQALGLTSVAALPPAVIVDLDETMIDNSPYQARMVNNRSTFDPVTWSAWVQEERANAISGAKGFVSKAQAAGVTVFYISNRSHDNRAATVANLKRLGWPTGANDEHVLLQGDPRALGKEKSSRRAWVATNHRVLMMLGDNLGDFIDGASKHADGSRLSVVQRDALAKQHAAHWGHDWIMFPNPTYGGWESAVRGQCDKNVGSDTCKRAALRE